MSTQEQQSLLAAMNTIVNVRSYNSTEIPKEVREELLFAFTLAPSLANTQPWELLIVEDGSQREQVIAATLDPFLTPNSYGGQSWLKSAPLMVIILVEKRRAMVRLGDLGEIFAIQDIYAAIQNARLTAAFHGLSTSCVREFDRERLQRNLNLPWYLEPVAILTSGYSEEEKEIPPRLSVADICL